MPYTFKNKKNIIYLKIHGTYVIIPKGNHEEILDLKTTKPAKKSQNSASPCLMSKCSSDLQLLSALFTEAQFFLLDRFYSIPEQVSHSSNISKSWGPKGNFNITASFNIQYPHMIFSAPPKRLGHFSSSALCITLISGWLHSPVPSVPAAHPMVLASSGCWVLLQLGLTDSLRFAQSIVSSLTCSTWQLHAFKTSTTWVILTHDQVQLHH